MNANEIAYKARLRNLLPIKKQWFREWMDYVSEEILERFISLRTLQNIWTYETNFLFAFLVFVGQEFLQFSEKTSAYLKR